MRADAFQQLRRQYIATLYHGDGERFQQDVAQRPNEFADWAAKRLGISSDNAELAAAVQASQTGDMMTLLPVRQASQDTRAAMQHVDVGRPVANMQTGPLAQRAMASPKQRPLTMKEIGQAFVKATAFEAPNGNEQIPAIAVAKIKCADPKFASVPLIDLMTTHTGDARFVLVSPLDLAECQLSARERLGADDWCITGFSQNFFEPDGDNQITFVLERPGEPDSPQAMRVDFGKKEITHLEIWD